MSTDQETKPAEWEDPRGTRPAISRSQGHLLGTLTPLATHGHITGCHRALAPRSHGKRGEWVSNPGHQAQSLHPSPTQGASQRTRTTRHACERGIPDGRRGFQRCCSDPRRDVHCRPQPSTCTHHTETQSSTYCVITQAVPFSFLFSHFFSFLSILPHFIPCYPVQLIPFYF